MYLCMYVCGKKYYAAVCILCDDNEDGVPSR